MLTSLHIHNFALIEDVEIEFTPGFNVFTGETGAGKSILIDAFSIALGARASTEYIRSGADAFWVQAVFDISDLEDIKKQLAEQDIENEDDTLFLRRKVTANGKSQASINGVQVPLAILTKIANNLVDIHGQHENQQLLHQGAPLHLVDLYGDKPVSDALAQYSDIFTEHKKATEALRDLEDKNTHQQELREELDKKIKEIELISPKEGEEDSLREKLHKLNNNEKIMDAVTLSYKALEGEDDAQGVLSSLVDAKNALAKAKEYDDSLKDVAEGLNSACISLEDIRQSLGDYLSSNDFDQNALNKMQERLDGIIKLKKKYGPSFAEVIEHYEDFKKSYEEINSLDIALKKAKIAKTELEEKLAAASSKLTTLRKKAGEKFSKEVTKHVKDLAMEQGQFIVNIAPKEEYTLLGKDDISFLFSANLGMEPKALQKIASGGELSRLALAIKTVLLGKSGVSTMVFDEIDTGVGGVTAQKMAEKIAIIAKCRQVLCITHLAQIACFGDNHLYISKATKGKATVTLVDTLGKEDKVTEIMRMISGDNATSSAKKNAMELLTRAEEIKEGL